ncbi:MAG: polyphosphate kinase 1 [Bacteroidales bacterium]|nr:polyphosphate kinase 1 [Bacteroidales bacterium]
MDYSYNNRELSWLSFNERVLQEAQDKSVPLMSRLQFLGIYSNNMDEFTKVRIANLMRLCRTRKERQQKLLGGYGPQDLLDAANAKADETQRTFETTYANILAEMEKEGIYVVNEKELNTEQRNFCREYFAQVIAQRLVPLMLRKGGKMPFLPDGNAYLGVKMSQNVKENKESAGNGKEPKGTRHADGQVRYAIIRIPVSSACPRFVVLPSAAGRKDVIFIEDIIRLMIDEIFFMFNYDNISAHTFKLMRDAELSIDDDVSKSLFERIAEGVESRRYGSPIRLIYDSTMPEDLLTLLAQKLKVDNSMLKPGGRYHLMKDLMKFPKVRPDLLTSSPDPLKHCLIKPFQSIINVVQRNDIFLNFPYHSFQHVIDFLREAAIDPQVESISITLYRTAEHSKIINALINAAKNGKRVQVLVELKARFDEEQNIESIDELQREGVKVIYAIEDLKVHSKIILVERREGSHLKGYAYIGTGNFNESTARIYGDFGLLTSHRGIVDDVRSVFEFLTNSHKRFKYKHLLVSPYYMRDAFSEMIEREERHARKGKPAYILAKCNSLTDERIIERLYRAAEAGVEIRLVVRGACCLKPEERGMSDNIRAISIVDKYLEHARLFIFCNEGKDDTYIGSADWMPRNLDRRVEVCTPILDEGIKKLVRKVFECQWSDNVKARNLSHQTDNTYANMTGSNTPLRSQTALYDYYKALSDKALENSKNSEKSDNN